MDNLTSPYDNTWIYYVIGFGSAALIITIAVIIYIWYKKKKAKENSNKLIEVGSTEIYHSAYTTNTT